MHGKSPPSEHILEIIKFNNYLFFNEDLEREIILFLQNIIISVCNMTDEAGTSASV